MFAGQHYTDLSCLSHNIIVVLPSRRSAPPQPSPPAVLEGRGYQQQLPPLRHSWRESWGGAERRCTR